MNLVPPIEDVFPERPLKDSLAETLNLVGNIALTVSTRL